MIKQTMQPLISINENLELKYENNDFLDLIDESKGCTETLCQQFEFRIGCRSCHLSNINLKYYFEHKLKDLKQQMIDYKSDFKKPCFNCSSSFHGSSYEDGHFNLQKMSQVDNECVICMTNFTMERSFHHNCNICNASFKNCQLLAHHNLTKHNLGNPHQCVACHQLLSHRAALRYHIRKHKLPYIICPYCNKTFATKRSFNSHMLISHIGETAFSCPSKYCPKQYKEKISLDYHYMLEHTDGKQYKCDLCDKTFAMQNLLNRHKIEHTDVKKFKCDVCSKTFPKGYMLNKHKNIHMDIFQCNFCPKKYKTRHYLNVHLYEHTDVKEIKCDLCEKTFVTPYVLKRHRYVVHMQENSFQCKYCPKKYKRKVSFDLHLYKHNGGKLFKCDLCKKKFAKRHSLNAHKHIHVERSKFYKTSKEVIEGHMSSVHNKEFKPDLDKEYCETEYELNKHESIHINNSFQCIYCAKEYQTQKSLDLHLVEHIDGNNVNNMKTGFRCMYCPKQFKAKYRLDLHLAEHLM